MPTNHSHFRSSFLCGMSITILIGGTLIMLVSKKTGEINAGERPQASKKENANESPDWKKIVKPVMGPGTPVSAKTSQPNTESPIDNEAYFDRKAKQLALQFRSGTLEEQAKLRKELESLNERHFEYRQNRRQQEIEQLSSRVDSLRVLQLRRQQNKAEVLKRRLNELLDPNADLDWGVDEDKVPSTRPAANQGLVSQTASQRDDPTPLSKVEDDPEALRLSKEIEKLQKQMYLGGTGLHHQQKLEEQIDELKRKLQNHVSPVPTYEGITLSNWLNRLRTERSWNEISKVLLVFMQLGAEVDSRTLVRAILQMSQNQPSFDFMGNDAVPLPINVLCKSSGDVVVDECFAELNRSQPRKLSKAFKRLFCTLVGTSTTLPLIRSEYYTIYDSQSAKVIAESIQPVIRQHSRKLVSALARIAEEDHSCDNWAVECGGYILEMRERPLRMYPDLIPAVERVFRSGEPDGLKAMAAAMLGSSGFHVEKVGDFFRSSLKREIVEDPQVSGGNTVFQFYTLILPIAKMARTSPLGVAILVDELSERWNKFEADRQSHSMKCQQLIDALGRVGDGAKSAIPFLREIEKSAAAETSSNFSNDRLESIKEKRPLVIRDHIADAIKQIEEAKPEPKPEPLTEDETPLHQVSESPMVSSNTTPEGDGINVKPSVERTFDGIPYSQWLKMLETERKPEKLAMAMEACSRLAEVRDQRRVARGIFLAAELFETADANEQQLVRQAGMKSLGRLPSDVFIDEFIAALRDNEAYKNGREFQGLLLQGTVPPSIWEAFKARADDVLAELKKVIQKRPQRADVLLSGASILLRSSHRPFSDYPELQKLIATVVDDGPSISAESSGYYPAAQHWKIVATNFIDLAPETPDLALKLMKHASQHNWIVELIGKLGHRGEPAVPLLVNLFLDDVKLIESKLLKDANQGGALPSSQDAVNDEQRRRFKRQQIIWTLGEIGCGENGYALLRQLCLIASPMQQSAQADAAWIGVLQKAFQKFAPDPPNGSKVKLLSDFSLMHGLWTLRTQWPDKFPQNAVAEFRNYWLKFYFKAGDYIAIANAITQSSFEDEYRYKLDETTNPKQISLFKMESSQFDSDAKRLEVPGTRREGIYELTETTLRIQLGKVGEARPTEFASDKSKLPDGQVLFEFDRQLDVGYTKGTDSK